MVEDAECCRRLLNKVPGLGLEFRHTHIELKVEMQDMTTLPSRMCVNRTKHTLNRVEFTKSTSLTSRSKRFVVQPMYFDLASGWQKCDN